MRVRSSTIVLLVLSIWVLAAGPAWGRGSAQPTLTLRGRACDSGGIPIAGAKITATTKKSVTAKTNSAGEYTLQLALVSLDELKNKPFTASVTCEAEGWHFSTTSGGAMLGLRVELASADSVTKCVARSNDARFAAETARAISDPTAVVTVPVTFIGMTGQFVGKPPEPELDQVAQMAVASTQSVATSQPVAARVSAPASAPAPPASAPAPPANPVAAKTDATPGGAPDSAASHATGSATSATGSAASQATSGAPRPATGSAASGASGSAAAPKPERTTMPASSVLTPAPKAAATSTKPSPSSTTQSRTSDKATEEARKKEERRVEAEARLMERQREIAEVNEAARLRDAEQLAERERKERARAEKNSKKGGRTRAGDVITYSVREAPASEGGAATQEAPPKQPVKTTDMPETGESRTRSAPLIIRGPGIRNAPLAKSLLDSCECRIRGTVEVESQTPLGSRVRVAVGTATAAADTVELFMGSPRSFELAHIACGLQTLRVSVLAGGRFIVRSSNAMSSFDCSGVRQFRLILSPR
jgi:hypothetical protein